MANSQDNIKAYATDFIGFDEVSGSAYDTIGGYLGTLVNNPVRVTGWDGKGSAMSFNGSNQYIDFNNKLINPGVKSVRFKIKANNRPSNYLGVFGNGFYSNNVHGFIVQLTPNDEVNVSWFNSTASVYSVSAKFTDADVGYGKWNDILFTFDGQKATIYANGVKKMERDVTLAETTPTYNFRIGATAGVLGAYFNGQLDQLEVYDRVISPIPDKYLVFNNDEYKYYNGTSWQATTATEENFIQYGMNQLSQITQAQWQQLSGDISVSMWSDFEDKKYINVVLERDSYTAKDLTGDEYTIVVLNKDEVEPQQLLLDAVSQPQIVYPIRDISLFGIKSIDSLTINGVGGGRVAISVDSGATWNALSGGSWSTITDASQGMSFYAFNALTDSELKVLLSDSKFIRFAYYLTGDTDVSSVVMKVSTEGVPEFANKNDYDLSYDIVTKTITYNIKKSGHYFVNYNDSE